MTARIGAYLIAVTAACMLAVMADALVKSPPVRRVARLVGGLLILLTVLSPLVRLEARDLSEFVEGFAQDADLDAEAVQTDYREQWAERVRELLEQNIEQQAASMGLTLRAEVVVRIGEYPEPESVTLHGAAAPEEQMALQVYLVQTLGFAKERVIWEAEDEDN